MINNNKWIGCLRAYDIKIESRSLPPYQHDSLIYVAVATRTIFIVNSRRASGCSVHEMSFHYFYTRRQPRPININKLRSFIFICFVWWHTHTHTQRATDRTEPEWWKMCDRRETAFNERMRREKREISLGFVFFSLRLQIGLQSNKLIK